MKRETTFHSIILFLTVIDSLLLSSPNFLGRIGLVIYKYHYLRTFPRTLLTVSLVLLTALLIFGLISFLVNRQILQRARGMFLLAVLVLLSISILIKTGLDFTAWTYSHTGHRFKYGAYLLPIILLLIFGYRLMRLLKPNLQIDPHENTSR